MFAKLLRRPVLSVVMSIVIVLLGLLAIVERPISQFPEIAPPQVTITIAYPGASAEILVKLMSDPSAASMKWMFES